MSDKRLSRDPLRMRLLAMAIEEGDADAVEALLPLTDARLPISRSFKAGGGTLLMMAVESDWPEALRIVRMLIGRGGVDALDAEGRSALSHAAWAGALGAARMLLDACPAMALVPDARGDLPLHLACHGADPELARELALRGGAQAPGAMGLLPLAVAAVCGGSELVEALLPLCDPFALDAGGRTASEHARREARPECAELIDAWAARAQKAQLESVLASAGPSRRRAGL